MTKSLVILHDAKDSTPEGRITLKNNLATHFKLEENTLDYLFDNLPVILKHSVDKNQADSFANELEKIGAFVEVLEQDDSLEPNQSEDAGETLSKQYSLKVIEVDNNSSTDGDTQDSSSNDAFDDIFGDLLEETTETEKIEEKVKFQATEPQPNTLKENAIEEQSTEIKTEQPLEFDDLFETTEESPIQASNQESSNEEEFLTIAEIDSTKKEELIQQKEDATILESIDESDDVFDGFSSEFEGDGPKETTSNKAEQSEQPKEENKLNEIPKLHKKSNHLTYFYSALILILVALLILNPFKEDEVESKTFVSLNKIDNLIKDQQGILTQNNSESSSDESDDSHETIDQNKTPTDEVIKKKNIFYFAKTETNTFQGDVKIKTENGKIIWASLDLDAIKPASLSIQDVANGKVEIWLDKLIAEDIKTPINLEMLPEESHSQITFKSAIVGIARGFFGGDEKNNRINIEATIGLEEAEGNEARGFWYVRTRQPGEKGWSVITKEKLDTANSKEPEYLQTSSGIPQNLEFGGYFLGVKLEELKDKTNTFNK